MTLIVVNPIFNYVDAKFLDFPTLWCLKQLETDSLVFSFYIATLSLLFEKEYLPVINKKVLSRLCLDKANSVHTHSMYKTHFCAPM